MRYAVNKRWQVFRLSLRARKMLVWHGLAKGLYRVGQALIERAMRMDSGLRPPQQETRARWRGERARWR